MPGGLSEESFIERLRALAPREGLYGIGDDGALLSEADGRVVASDTLVEEVHFFADAAPADVGYKLLATNISDLHAMGALPRAWTMNVATPTLDAAWADAFIEGLSTARDELAPELALIGGDTTRSPGPLVLSATLVGRCVRTREGRLSPLSRSGARPDTRVWVRGALGWAAAGLHAITHGVARELPSLGRALSAHRRPLPPPAEPSAWERLDAGLDVSDGLAKDLGRLARASGVGVELDEEALRDLDLDRLHAALSAGGEALAWVLSGGDDYALVGTADERPGPDWRCIGRTVGSEPTLTLRRADGSRRALAGEGFEHFEAATEAGRRP